MPPFLFFFSSLFLSSLSDFYININCIVSKCSLYYLYSFVLHFKPTTHTASSALHLRVQGGCKLLPIKQSPIKILNPPPKLFTSLCERDFVCVCVFDALFFYRFLHLFVLYSFISSFLAGRVVVFVTFDRDVDVVSLLFFFVFFLSCMNELSE